MKDIKIYMKHQENMKEVLDSHIDIENLPNVKDKLILDEFKDTYVEKAEKLDKFQRRELK